MRTLIFALVTLLPSPRLDPPVITDEIMRAYVALESSSPGKAESGLPEGAFANSGIDRDCFRYIRSMHRSLLADATPVKAELTFRGHTAAEIRTLLQIAPQMASQIKMQVRQFQLYLSMGLPDGEKDADTPRDTYMALFRSISSGLPGEETDIDARQALPAEVVPLRDLALAIFDKADSAGERGLSHSDSVELTSILVRASEIGVALFEHDARAWLERVRGGMNRRGLWRIRLSDADHRNLPVVEKALGPRALPDRSTAMAARPTESFAADPWHLQKLRKAQKILQRLPALLDSGAEETEVLKLAGEAIRCYRDGDDYADEGRFLTLDSGNTVALRRLLSGDGDLPIAAIAILECCGPGAAPLAGELIALLPEMEGEDLLLEMLLNTLSLIGPPAARATPRVLELLDRDDGSLVVYASAALGRIGGSGAKRLAEFFAQADPDIREDILRGLAKHDARRLPLAEDTLAVPRVGLTDVDPGIRVRSAAILGQYSTGLRESIPVLLQLLGGEEGLLLEKALSALSQMPGAAATTADPIVDLLQTAHERRTMREAIEALEMLGRSARHVLPRLRMLAEGGHPFEKKIRYLISVIRR